MAKVRLKDNLIMFHCPGCKHAHSVPVDRWQWNGSIDRPTITPSLKISTPAVNEPDLQIPAETLCHVVVTDGVLHYCGDCAHDLNGQEIPMVEWSSE